MWHLKMTVPKYVAFDLDQKIGEDALSISSFEKDEKNLIWGLDVLFNEKSQAEKAIETLSKDIHHEIQWEIVPLSQKNWLEENRKSFAPISLGSFYIHGSHITQDLPKDKICLQLDASTAFGSGEHATTKGCLQAIEAVCSKHPFKKPMDMGCGTGVLAFAAAALLQVPVVAVDNDPEAIRKTLENATVNSLSHLVTAYESQGWRNIQEKGFDLVIANILAGPLCDLAPSMRENMTEKSTIILSGLLNTQKDQVIGAYILQGFRLMKEYPIEDWQTLVMCRG